MGKGNLKTCSGECFKCGNCKTVADIKAQVQRNTAAGIIPERFLHPEGHDYGKMRT